jgi:CDP-diglyceride synthetase
VQQGAIYFMQNLPFCLVCIGQTTLLLLAANGAPIIFRNLLGQNFSTPIDLGKVLADGHPLFGTSKTWRGLIAAITVTMLVAPLINLSALFGALFGLLSISGDLLASFTKRRLGLPESSRTRGIDVIPESLLPAFILKDYLALAWIDIAAVIGLFFCIELFLSPVLYRMHIRKRPY